MEKKRIYISLHVLPDDPREADKAYGDLMAEKLTLSTIDRIQFFNGNIASDTAFKKHLREADGMIESSVYQFMVGDRVAHRGYLDGEQVISRIPGIITDIEETEDRILSYTVNFKQIGKQAVFTPSEMREDVMTAFTTLSKQTLLNAPYLRWSITGWKGVEVSNWQAIIDELAPHTDDTICLCGNRHQIELISDIIAKREKFNFRYL